MPRGHRLGEKSSPIGVEVPRAADGLRSPRRHRLRHLGWASGDWYGPGRRGLARRPRRAGRGCSGRSRPVAVLAPPGADHGQAGAMSFWPMYRAAHAHVRRDSAPAAVGPRRYVPRRAPGSRYARRPGEGRHPRPRRPSGAGAGSCSRSEVGRSVDCQEALRRPGPGQRRRATGACTPQLLAGHVDDLARRLASTQPQATNAAAARRPAGHSRRRARSGQTGTADEAAPTGVGLGAGAPSASAILLYSFSSLASACAAARARARRPRTRRAGSSPNTACSGPPRTSTAPCRSSHSSRMAEPGRSANGVGRVARVRWAMRTTSTRFTLPWFARQSARGHGVVDSLLRREDHSRCVVAASEAPPPRAPPAARGRVPDPAPGRRASSIIQGPGRELGVGMVGDLSS